MEKITKDRLDEVLKNPPPENGRYIRVGMSSCGVAAGAAEVFAVLRSEVEKRKTGRAVVLRLLGRMSQRAARGGLAWTDCPRSPTGGKCRDCHAHLSRKNVRDKRAGSGLYRGRRP